MIVKLLKKNPKSCMLVPTHSMCDYIRESFKLSPDVGRRIFPWRLRHLLKEYAYKSVYIDELEIILGMEIDPPILLATFTKPFTKAELKRLDKL